MIKSPDIAGFLSGVFAILAALPPLYWTIFDQDVDVVASSKIYLTFYLSGEPDHDGFLSVVAPMSYYSTTKPGRVAAIIHEKVVVDFLLADRSKSYLLRWQHFVEGGTTFIDSSKIPIFQSIDDAEAFAFNGQTVETHSTLFAPRTELRSDPFGDTKRNYVTRAKAKMFIAEARKISLSFESLAYPDVPLKYRCEILINDRGRRLLKKKLNRGDNIIEVPGECREIGSS